MVIVKLLGGLGNQMFQYAAGKALSQALKTTLKIDATCVTSGFETEDVIKRPYELGVFNIEEKFADQRDIENFKMQSSVSFLNKILKGKYHYFKETQYHFDDGFFDKKGNIYLDGFWQSEKYFKSIESQIRKDFTIKSSYNVEREIIADKIKTTNAIGIHIRRGDYVSNSFTNSYHGTCDLSYYQKAVTEIKTKVTNPTFFVFSDDIIWAENNISLDSPTYFISNNTGTNSFKDMILMSACKHNIIANSSFSWWGSWLNSNIEKTIIAPSIWFRKPEIRTEDLIPESWKQL